MVFPICVIAEGVREGAKAAAIACVASAIPTVINLVLDCFKIYIYMCLLFDVSC